MIRGLLLKSFREVWFSTCIFAVCLGSIKALFAYVLPTFAKDFEMLWAPTFVKSIIGAMLGTEIGDSIGPFTFAAISWVHPLVIALVWTHELTFCSRLPAGEIDRGTIDVVMSLPVSRVRLYVCDSLVWLATGLFLIAFAVIGDLVGTAFVADGEKPAIHRVLAVAANFYGLYIGVGGFVYFLSSSSSSRGSVIRAALLILIASFLLNFLVPFWKPAKSFELLSALTYYRPMAVLNGGGLPLWDTAILAGGGFLFWAAGALRFRNRDICTV